LNMQGFFVAIIGNRCSELWCSIQMPPPDLCIATHAIA